MKDYDEISLRTCRPDKDPVECVEFCLKNLIQDKKHTMHEIVAGKCTYKELIGALLLAEDEIFARRL